MEKASSTAAQSEKLLNAIAFRFTLVFLIPLVAVVGISVYAYHLASRLNEVEALALVMNTEQLLQSTKNGEWAIRSYEKIKDRYPRPEVFARLGWLYFAQGDKKAAYAVLEQARRPKPEYWEIYSTLTYLYFADGKEKEAVDTGETALVLNPRDAQTLNNLAWIYATTENNQLRDLHKARDYAKKAVKLTGGQKSTYLDTLAEVYFRTGEVEPAVKAIRVALTREMRDVVYLQSQLQRFQVKNTKVGRTP